MIMCTCACNQRTWPHGAKVNWKQIHLVEIITADSWQFIFQRNLLKKNVKHPLSKKIWVSALQVYGSYLCYIYPLFLFTIHIYIIPIIFKDCHVQILFNKPCEEKPIPFYLKDTSLSSSQGQVGRSVPRTIVGSEHCQEGFLLLHF